ncbi:MAG: malate:quinone oxidoreductase [Chitinophagaceae bacterium]|nr:malate:quinone oxidoreductase [Chitinophagaceae bacterium]
MKNRTIDLPADIILIGAGIMSATLGTLLKQLDPLLTIEIFERLDVAAAESSDAWNNAGTGHSAFCELNYTPEQPGGRIDTSKAIKIASSFEESKQFWAFLSEKNILIPPGFFIKSIPHMSFVWGDHVAYLRKRYEALIVNHLFAAMQYSEDVNQLLEWMPLVMEGRDNMQPLAATRMDLGTDVNFGSLTRSLFKHLETLPGVKTHFNHDVEDIVRGGDGMWEIKVKGLATRDARTVKGKFVFIGAGGGSLPLLLKSGIPESKGYGGFPVSGQWLKCINPAIIERHHAKVYGKAAVGSPPMSVPHLDTRMIKGKRELLFGPYAGFSTKFLKQGSLMDLPKSLRLSNIVPLMAAGLHNIPLTKYLIQQVTQSPQERLAALREYLPLAQMEDWQLATAGQRVQVIKKDEEQGGILEFGTEVVSAQDGSIAAILGASPGASTAVSIMLGLAKRCFPAQYSSELWQRKLKEMIPSFGQSLHEDQVLCEKVRKWTSSVLGLNR